MSKPRLFAKRWLGALTACALLMPACAEGPLPPNRPKAGPPNCSISVSPDDPSYGDTDALVTAVLFGDPTVASTYLTLNEVLSVIVREGSSKVRIVYKMLPADDEGTRLADTSLTVRKLAGTTAFFQYQRLLLSGFTSNIPRPFAESQLLEWAKIAGLQNDEALVPWKSVRNQRELDEHRALARRLRVQQPPALFINGQLTPLVPEGVITETLEREIKKSESRLATGLPRGHLYATACAENKGRGIDDIEAVNRTLSSGLAIVDSRVGKGREALPGDKVTVHYIGSLANGGVFDSSVDRGIPFEFTIGNRQVIQGWERGVVGMRVGGKRELTIPPDLGYGARGQPPRIPPNATLRFEIELIEVTNGEPPPKPSRQKLQE